MTLTEWQHNERIKGTYAWIQKELEISTGKKWSLIWLRKVFAGDERPGLELFLALKELTSLTDNELTETFNLRQRLNASLGFARHKKGGAA